MTVLVGLGSNQSGTAGDSSRILLEAMVRLCEFAAGGRVKASRLWRTSPVDCPPDSPDFINAAVRFEPRGALEPEQLLKALKALEQEFGRGAPAVRNAPRVLDLDLLVFGEQQRCDPDIQLPHPRATERRFVLAPCAEIAGSLCWPGTGRTIDQLLEALQTDEQVEPLVDSRHSA